MKPKERGRPPLASPERIERNRGWLLNGNTPGDLTKAKPCGAWKKGRLARCKAPAMKNGRCYFHGGPSTGPRTPEGLHNSRHANYKHGFYSTRAKQVRQDARRTMCELAALLESL